MKRKMQCFKKLPLLSGLMVILLIMLCGGAYSQTQVIMGAECFIDTDPGEGNGFAMQADDGAFDEEIEEVYINNIPTDNLFIGFHTVYVRFQGSDGEWCIPKPLMNDLRISRSNLRILGEIYITDAEYFVDTDPGEGNGIPIEAVKLLPADGGFEPVPDVFDKKQVYLQEEMPTTGLTGSHNLFVRVQDSTGLWGVARKFPFTVYDLMLMGAEFFIDVDPGKGFGVELYNVNDIWERVDYDLFAEYPYPDYLTTGYHEVFARFMDQYGIWGVTEEVPLLINVNGDVNGDANGDGSINVQDVICIINHILGTGTATGSPDCNDDGDVNVLDVICVINKILGG